MATMPLTPGRSTAESLLLLRTASHDNRPAPSPGAAESGPVAALIPGKENGVQLLRYPTKHDGDGGDGGGGGGGKIAGGSRSIILSCPFTPTTARRRRQSARRELDHFLKRTPPRLTRGVGRRSDSQRSKQLRAPLPHLLSVPPRLLVPPPSPTPPPPQVAPSFSSSASSSSPSLSTSAVRPLAIDGAIRASQSAKRPIGAFNVNPLVLSRRGRPKVSPNIRTSSAPLPPPPPPPPSPSLAEQQTHAQEQRHPHEGGDVSADADDANGDVDGDEYESTRCMAERLRGRMSVVVKRARTDITSYPSVPPALRYVFS